MPTGYTQSFVITHYAHHDCDIRLHSFLSCNLRSLTCLILSAVRPTPDQMPLGNSLNAKCPCRERNICTCIKRDSFLLACDFLQTRPIYSHAHKLPAIDKATRAERLMILSFGAAWAVGELEVSDLLVNSRLKPRLVVLWQLSCVTSSTSSGSASSMSTHCAYRQLTDLGLLEQRI